MKGYLQPLVVRHLSDPPLPDHGARISVKANGICRSDWHTWVGDWGWLGGPPLEFPFVLGHEFCGIVEEVGSACTRVAVDALGVTATCRNSVLSLRKRGRHLQIGLTGAAERGYIAVPIDLIVIKELTLLGSVGMAPPRYCAMLQLVERGVLRPGSLVSRTVSFEEAGAVLASMDRFGTVGVVVIDRY